ncbi:MAG: hypothetical protein ACI9LY_000518 [Arenicella sp.]|jgi:hypothetical protein
MVVNSDSLLTANPQLVFANGVYHETESQVRETSLSHYVRTYTHDIFTSADDRSLLSVELEALATTDELRQAFSPAPHYFLLALELEKELNNVLDLSQDLGGVSHYLSSKAALVDSIKVDIGRANIAAHRCRKLANVKHISEDLAALKFPDQHYDLIIVGNLSDLGLNQTELQTFLQRLNQTLGKEGCLLFVNENKNRLDKWLSKGSHRIPYRDLYYDSNTINLSYPELTQLLNDSGIAHANFFASFSSANKISNLFAQDYLQNNANAVNHFNRIGAIDNGELNEYLFFKNLADQHSYFTNASSYVVIAGSDLASVNGLCQNNFTHFPGTGRKAQWRTVTANKRGTNLVSKTPILDEESRFKRLNESSSEPVLVQDISSKQFYQGPLLLDEWLSMALHNDTSGLGTLINEYATWLRSLEQEEKFTDVAYDLLPFNIIVEGEKRDRQFKIIDSEWQLKTQYSADFVLFRALFWFAFENKAILKSIAYTTKLTSIGLFVCHFMDGINTVSDLQEFVELEENIQRQISSNFRKKSVEFALNQLFNSDSLIVQSKQPACQVSWGNSAQVFDEANSVFLNWNKSSQRQSISADLAAADDLNILRVDPIASTGIFEFSAITLRDQEQNIIWQLESSDDIIANSTHRNLSTVANKAQANSFIALNNDPHFLFDLSSVLDLRKIANIELDFALTHDENYDNALATLSHIVNEQNSALVEQANGINEKLAQIEVLQAELINVRNHRAEIKSNLHQTKQATATQIQQLTEHVANLEHAIMMRPLSRVKRLINRLIGRK